MRRVISALAFAASVFVVQPAFATTVSLQSILINANGTQYVNENAVPGVNTAGWNAATGEGTLTFLFNPGPGSYSFDVFFDHQLSLPFFNEFGTVNGAPAAGQTFEIGDSFASNIYPDVQAGGALPNINTLPGQASNFANNCIGANCNGDFAAAMGFQFVLGAGQAGLITFQIGEVNPGGFSLQGTHPTDPANGGGSNANSAVLSIFITGSLAIVPNDQPPPSPVPEPSSLYLLATAGGPMLWKLRRRIGL
jgi:hypothetical protein